MSLLEGKTHLDPARALARRQQVLSAAESCFAKSGFHGASMAEISHAANMSPGHIYNYFLNKEAIIAAIAEQKIESTFAQADETLQSHIYRHIKDCDKPEQIAVMFDIFAEAVRNPKMAEIVQSLNKLAKKRLEDLCSEKFSFPREELAQRVEVLRIFIFGFKACKMSSPDFNDAAVLALLEPLIGQLFQPNDQRRRPAHAFLE